MIRVLFAFLVLTTAFWFGISIFRDMSNKERWQFFKTLFYAGMMSCISILFLIAIVILF